MLVYDKLEIRKSISTDQVFDLLVEWGGEPMLTSFGIISSTICHNEVGIGSHKLYYYSNEDSDIGGLFHCYTGCEEPSFDLFELTIKVFRIQKNVEMDLNEAVRYIAAKVGLSGRLADEPEKTKLVDWEILSNYDRIQGIELNNNHIVLKEYDQDILSRFNYSLKLTPWLKDGISQEVLAAAGIGYYLGGDQITIPHYDINNRLIGIRGRTMCDAEAEHFGKYRPLKINGILYNHPLGINLYFLNEVKDNIARMQKAIVFESEKAALQLATMLGVESSIGVATCGSNLSDTQVRLLLELGINELVVAFDKQYEALNTEESKQWSKKLQKYHNKYKNDCLVSFIWDKQNLLPYKASPTDMGKETFMQLFKERIML